MQGPGIEGLEVQANAIYEPTETTLRVAKNAISKPNAAVPNVAKCRVVAPAATTTTVELASESAEDPEHGSLAAAAPAEVPSGEQLL